MQCRRLKRPTSHAFQIVTAIEGTFADGGNRSGNGDFSNFKIKGKTFWYRCHVLAYHNTIDWATSERMMTIIKKIVSIAIIFAIYSIVV